MTQATGRPAATRALGEADFAAPISAAPAPQPASSTRSPGRSPACRARRSAIAEKNVTPWVS